MRKSSNRPGAMNPENDRTAVKSRNLALLAIRGAIVKTGFLSFLVVLVVFGAVIIALLPPLVLEKGINLLAAGNLIPWNLILGYFGLLLLAGLLGALREALLTVFGQKITHYLRSTLCEKLMRLPADTFVKTEPGVTASRFVGDVDTVETLFTSGIISMFADACKILSIFAILFVKNLGLALLLLLLMPVIAVFTRGVQKRMLVAEKDNRAAIGKVANHVPETIRCIRTIHNLRAEGYMQKKYDRHIEDSYAAVEKTNFFDAIYSPVIITTNAFVVATVMILASSGNNEIRSFFGMSVGTAVAVISYISQVFTPVENIGMEIQTIQSAAAGIHRINEFLQQAERNPETYRDETGSGREKAKAANGTSDLAQERANGMSDLVAEPANGMPDSGVKNDNAQGRTPDTVPVPDSPELPCITLSDVSFQYNEDKKVLSHLNLSVASGEQVTMTGRTGAGKSTIFKLLLGLYSPQEGSVLIKGRNAFEIPDCEKRRLFGYVEQSFYMVPGSVRDQITLFDADISQEAAETAAKTVGLHEVICSLPKGYDTFCEEGIFSEGQWQLLSIARAIASQPEILLLDEITANLDSDTEEMVLTALKNASKNRTVLSISHRLYENMGGREYVLHECQTDF